MPGKKTKKKAKPLNEFMKEAKPAERDFKQALDFVFFSFFDCAIFIEEVDPCIFIIEV